MLIFISVKDDLLKRAMREMGKKGGKRSLETMTSEERANRARNAAAKSAEVRSKKATATKKPNPKKHA